MARIVAERLVEHLERSGFVIMKRPPNLGRLAHDGAGGTICAYCRSWRCSKKLGLCMATVGMAKDHRFTNFDTIRLIAAASVIFSHAFLIADGNEKNEPFERFTGAIIGIHGVFVFLIISGFLVTQSLKNSFSLRHFAWKRLLRIYPALAACAIVSAFAIAPFFSELSLREYLWSFSGMKYVVKVLLLYDVYEIHSVKFYDQEIQHLGYSVNGSLWTIASELYCYLILFFLAALDLVKIRIALFGLFTGSVLLALSLAVNLPVSYRTISLNNFKSSALPGWP
jgi:peptidoglycan/LPS O-acetylase OafA/YrhL